MCKVSHLLLNHTVGQVAAESMIHPGVATPITTIVSTVFILLVTCDHFLNQVFAVSTSIFALKEVYKV